MFAIQLLCDHTQRPIGAALLQSDSVPKFEHLSCSLQLSPFVFLPAHSQESALKALQPPSEWLKVPLPMSSVHRKSSMSTAEGIERHCTLT